MKKIYVARLFILASTLIPPLMAQSVSFQNNYRQDGKLISDDLVLSQKLYNTRSQVTLRSGDTWYARNNTLFVIKPSSFLPDSAVRRENRFYIGDYHLFLNVPRVSLSIQNDKREIPFTFVVDEAGPEVAVFTKIASTEAGVLLLGVGSKVECFAWDAGSGVESLTYQLSPESKSGPKLESTWEPFKTAFAPEPSAKKLFVSAVDRLGNRNLLEWEIRFDTRAPTLDYKVGGSGVTEQHWHKSGDDEYLFSKSNLEVSLFSKDDLDKTPDVFKSTNLAAGFTPYREPIRLSSDTVIFFYALDLAGNQSPVKVLKFFLRDQVPSLQVR